MNALYFGDNLHVLRESIKDESVDLVYLDPPFNSKRDYNILFKSPKGHSSDAQISAFDDSWHWGPQAEREFDELLHQANTDVAEMMRALRKFLGENDMMAYLTMMANRLLELRRVLKPTGSLYLHCDPTASHYLKIVLDGVFGAENFLSEITWKRTGTHSSADRWGPVHDTLLFYAKKVGHVWNRLYVPLADDHRERHYRHADEHGRKYTHGELTAPGVRHGRSGVPWKGFDVTALGRHWMTTVEKLDDLFAEGRIYLPVDGSWPRLIRFEEDSKGRAVGDVWVDISPINMQARERLGYPTQKPVALLERIINASSNEGDLVLDPFCGCGTAVHAAQKLKRNWMGIDITHLAISLIEKRLRDAFPGITFEVHGTPKDIGGAQNLALRDKYQFQWWACSLVNAQPYQGKKKGADSGIDGLIFFQDEHGEAKKIIVSVKGGENVGVAQVRDLKGTVEREGAQLGLFVTLTPPTRPMSTEAVSAGFYESQHHGQFPRIQILTIEGLMQGTERALYPDVARGGGLVFKKAKVEKPIGNQEKLF